MDTTDNFDLPYPECDPPEVKDASDIIQFKNLAFAVDDAVQTYADQIQDRVISPDTARLNNGAGVTSSSSENLLTMTATTFDNTAGDAMSDLMNGGIRIQTPGWYYCGFWITSQVATDVQTRARFLVNLEPVTAFRGPSGLVTPGQQNIVSSEFLQMFEGDLLQLQSRNGAAGTSVTYVASLWAWLVAPDV